MTETTETAAQAAVCPFCFKPMVAEADSWYCENHKLSFPRCPVCKVPPLDPQSREIWRCAHCQKWFDAELKIVMGEIKPPPTPKTLSSSDPLGH